MKNWVLRWVGSALALFIITKLNVGVSVKNLDQPSGIATLFLAVVAIGLINSLIRPVIMFFAWPINCLTFGLLGFVINVLLFWLAGSSLVPGFVVATPMAALIGSVLMGALSGLFNFFLQDKGERRRG